MRIELKKLVEERSITSVFVTHDQLEAMSMSDEIAVLFRGEVLQKGNPEEIYHHPKRIEIAEFVGHSNWINATQMIRPEKISLKRQGDDEIPLPVKIKSTQFLGANYELIVLNNDKEWKVLSPVRYSLNEEILIYINKKNIIEFREEIK
jgi:iron(III) transport system ATP-binding protein